MIDGCGRFKKVGFAVTVNDPGPGLSWVDTKVTSTVYVFLGEIIYGGVPGPAETSEIEINTSFAEPPPGNFELAGALSG